MAPQFGKVQSLSADVSEEGIVEMEHEQGSIHLRSKANHPRVSVDHIETKSINENQRNLQSRGPIIN